MDPAFAMAEINLFGEVGVLKTINHLIDAAADRRDALLHHIADFIRADVRTHVRKGQGVPAYSAFEGVTDDGASLADVLRTAGVTEVDITGIATDYCVRATALDARKEGFAVRLLDGLHAGVAPDTSAAALRELAEVGVAV